MNYRGFSEDVLEELEGRRTFSAFLNNSSEDQAEPTQPAAGCLPGQDHIKHRHRLSHHHHGIVAGIDKHGLANFILADRAIYKQRTWLVRLTCDSQPQQVNQSTLSPSTSTIKARQHRRHQSPASTLMSIGEEHVSAGLTHNNQCRSECDVKAWPCFRQYKSIVAASQASRIPKFQVTPIVLKGKPKLTTGKASAGMSPTITNIVQARRTGQFRGSPLLRSHPDSAVPQISNDVNYLLHLIRLAVLDGQESKACAILSQCFGVGNVPEPKIQIKSAIKQSLLLKPKLWPTILRIWLRAVDKKMERLLLLLYEAGIPSSPLAPITFVAQKKKPTQRFYSLAGLASSVSLLSTGSTSTAAAAAVDWIHKNYREWLLKRVPSYLQAAIAFGCDQLSKAFLEGSKRIGSIGGWLNLGPVILAAAGHHGRGRLLLTRQLLEFGADPTEGISLYTFLLARRKLLEPIARKVNHRSLLQHPNHVSPEVIKSWCKNHTLTPIEVATAARNFELVILLLGASRLTFSQHIELGLLLQTDLDIAIRLLKSGANPQFADPFGNGLLHRAASRGRVDLIAVLLHHGASIDAVNHNGCTALHEAAMRGHVKVVRYLIQAGADCSILNADRMTALEVARRHGMASEDLQDCFTSKPKGADHKDLASSDEDMKALLKQVESFDLTEDLRNKQPSFYTPGSIPNSPAENKVERHKRGRFLIEKIIRNPKQWWN